MELKIGDKLCCKKFFHYYTNNGLFIVKKNKDYEISDLYTTTLTGQYFYKIKTSSFISFSFDNKELYEFFYTKLELRKEKLKKIENL